MRVDCRNRYLKALLVAAVCFGSELDYSVKGNFDVWEIFLREIMEVGVSALKADQSEYLRRSGPGSERSYKQRRTA
jgi:hypothetical protein